MAKRGNSVIGIDLGKHSLKGVVLQRRGDARYVLTNYASHEVPENLNTAEQLGQELKTLLKELGGGSKACALAVSDPDALLRIVEQPDTPVELLRGALRFNGLMVLNQDCKEFVLDCAPVSNKAPSIPVGDENGSNDNGNLQVSTATQTKYLVAGLLRSTVKQVCAAVAKTRVSPETMQLAPVCSFNAFEFAYPEVFANEAFLLLDMGHLQSTVLIGSKHELVLVRSIDYGGKSLLETLSSEGGLDLNGARSMLQQSDAASSEICRGSLVRLATEVRNSIGFFEGQREESIHRIFVSGGLARAELVLQTLSDELGLPCEIWDPLEMCEVALPPAKRQALPNEFVSLNVACGAAFEYLRN
ncbi:MAG TPA: pilus assembly protein PilM [Chthoniobacterales bacterium]